MSKKDFVIIERQDTKAEEPTAGKNVAEITYGHSGEDESRTDIPDARNTNAATAEALEQPSDSLNRENLEVANRADTGNEEDSAETSQHVAVPLSEDEGVKSRPDSGEDKWQMVEASQYQKENARGSEIDDDFKTPTKAISGAEAAPEGQAQSSGIAAELFSSPDENHAAVDREPQRSIMSSTPEGITMADDTEEASRTSDVDLKDWRESADAAQRRDEHNLSAAVQSKPTMAHADDTSGISTPLRLDVSSPTPLDDPFLDAMDESFATIRPSSPAYSTDQRFVQPAEAEASGPSPGSDGADELSSMTSGVDTPSGATPGSVVPDSEEDADTPTKKAHLYTHFRGDPMFASLHGTTGPPLAGFPIPFPPSSASRSQETEQQKTSATRMQEYMAARQAQAQAQLHAASSSAEAMTQSQVLSQEQSRTYSDYLSIQNYRDNMGSAMKYLSIGKGHRNNVSMGASQIITHAVDRTESADEGFDVDYSSGPECARTPGSVD